MADTPGIALDLFDAGDVSQVQRLADQAERAVRALDKVSAVGAGARARLGAGGGTAAAMLPVSTDGYDLGMQYGTSMGGAGNGLAGLEEESDRARQKSNAMQLRQQQAYMRMASAGYSAASTIGRLADGSAFGSVQGGFQAVASLNEPLQKFAPALIATRLAAAAPAIQVAAIAIGTAQSSYDSTMSGQATAEQVARLYGAGQYGSATYAYAQNADRRGLFSGGNAAPAMAALEMATVRAGRLNPRSSEDQEVFKRAQEMARAAGGGYAPVLDAANKRKIGALTLENMASALDSAQNSESLRLGRELMPAEQMRMRRETLASFVKDLEPASGEAFLGSLSDSEKKRVETYAPENAKALYQRRLGDQRAAAYGRLGLAYNSKPRSYGTDDKNNSGPAGEAGVKGDDTPIASIEEEEGELPASTVRARRESQRQADTTPAMAGDSADLSTSPYPRKIDENTYAPKTIDESKYALRESKPVDENKYAAKARGAAKGAKWTDGENEPVDENKYAPKEKPVFKGVKRTDTVTVGAPAKGWTELYGAGKNYVERSGKQVD